MVGKGEKAFMEAYKLDVVGFTGDARDADNARDLLGERSGKAPAGHCRLGDVLQIKALDGEAALF